MNSTERVTVLPKLAQFYLRTLRGNLWALPQGDQREVIAGIEAHIREGLGAANDDPDRIDDVLGSLGTPEEVAQQALDDFEERTGRTAHPKYLTVPRGLQIGVLALVVAATLAALLLPAGISDTQLDSGDHIIVATTLLQSNSPIVLIPMTIPLLLAIVPLLARKRGWRAVSIASTALLGVFAVIASATLGWFYLPALLLAVVAVSLPWRGRV